MIKYFSYEEYYKSGKWFYKNIKILNEKPKTNTFGWDKLFVDSCVIYYVDVEKYINYNISFNSYLQEIYDKLVLIETRNLKLETL